MAAVSTETFVPVYKTIKLPKIQEYPNPSINLGLTFQLPSWKRRGFKTIMPSNEFKTVRCTENGSTGRIKRSVYCT